MGTSDSEAGLFDTLYCDYPIPERTLQRSAFRTQALGETLSDYVITTNGRLVRLRYKDHGKPHNPERPRPPPSFLDPRVDPDSIERTDIAYHGDIHFYTTVESRVVIEFVARFTHGNLEGIRLHKRDSTEQRQAMQVLALRAERLETDYWRALRRLFCELETLDPELFNRGLSGWVDPTRTARWFGSSRPRFRERNAYRMVVDGDRDAVLKVLTRIEDTGRPGT